MGTRPFTGRFILKKLHKDPPFTQYLLYQVARGHGNMFCTTVSNYKPGRGAKKINGSLQCLRSDLHCRMFPIWA
jgi:hypothetical protein